MTTPDPNGEKMTTEQLAFPNHEHTSSVYVRCKECLMFGIPMPGEFACGNCGSNNTVSLLRTCCVKAAEEASYEAGIGDSKIIDAAHDQGFGLGYKKGFAEAKEMAAKVANEPNLDVHPECGRSVSRCIRHIRPPARGEGEKV